MIDVYTGHLFYIDHKKGQVLQMFIDLKMILQEIERKKAEKSEPIFDKKLCSNWIPAARFDIKNDLLLLEKFPKNLQVM